MHRDPGRIWHQTPDGDNPTHLLVQPPDGGPDGALLQIILTRVAWGHPWITSISHNFQHFGGFRHTGLGDDSHRGGGQPIWFWTVRLVD